jgi:hypothetical protein BACCOPRO_02344
VKDAYFPYEEAYCEPLSRYSYFSATDSSVIFGSFRFDGLMEIMKSGKQAAHSVLMDLKHPIPEGLRAKTESYDGSSPYEFVAQTPVACRQYWFVEVTKDKKSECYVYDRHAGKLYGNDGQATDRMAFIVGSDGTHFIGYVPDKAYYEELVKFGLQQGGQPDRGTFGTRGKRVGLIPDEIGTSRKVEIPSACHRTGGGDGFI